MNTTTRINVHISPGVTAADIVRELDRYRLREMRKPRGDEDGTAGVAAVVPIRPRDDSPGMTLTPA